MKQLSNNKNIKSQKTSLEYINICSPLTHCGIIFLRINICKCILSKHLLYFSSESVFRIDFTR